MTLEPTPAVMASDKLDVNDNWVSTVVLADPSRAPAAVTLLMAASMAFDRLVRSVFEVAVDREKPRMLSLR